MSSNILTVSLVILDVNSWTLTLFLGKNGNAKDRKVRIKDAKMYIYSNTGGKNSFPYLLGYSKMDVESPALTNMSLN